MHCEHPEARRPDLIRHPLVWLLACASTMLVPAHAEVALTNVDPEAVVPDDSAAAKINERERELGDRLAIQRIAASPIRNAPKT